MNSGEEILGLSWAGPQVLQRQGQKVAVRISRGQVHSDAAAGFPDEGLDGDHLAGIPSQETAIIKEWPG